ncbi:BLUF domain-containing protein [Cytophagaceae bacterium YF14B1]|uniref:BLUF domain-containing protein n=1 Tax=Xanthocytophaga flava TaxID=3048013 RepID=A0AAE3UAJ4_9BACT|nr:BLUF domain-containing protein [Xanthocytophaga flavus]MDJ1485611.1 BLUF domain-containing protein [Xanthocytophaga flavus]
MVYVSLRKSNCTTAEIEKIVASCQKNNAPLDITGVLLYSETNFIQYLEGDAKTILSLYDQIKTDPRHEQVRMICYGPVSERSFPSWHMATKAISHNELAFRTDITAQDKQTFKQLLTGQAQSDSRALMLLKKFFEPATQPVKA